MWRGKGDNRRGNIGGIKEGEWERHNKIKRD